jgi:parvulin-like peptidyl-prolyl isomerase
MRRSMLLVATLALSLGACGKSDMFSAHPDVAAKAAGQELTAERVAEILTSVKGISLDPVAANFVANLWVDYTLLAQKLVTGDAMTDSLFIREAMWTEVASYQAGQFFDSLMAARDPLAPAKLDSAITASGMINIQHVLINVEQTASEAQRVAARRKIDGILAQARNGADFAELARANSDDPGSAQNGGY